MEEGIGVNVGIEVEVEVDGTVTVINVAAAVNVSAATAVIEDENFAIEVLMSSNDRVGIDSTVGLPALCRVPIRSRGGLDAEAG